MSHTPPTLRYTDADAAQLAGALYMHQWRSDAKNPRLNAISAHREHGYYADCAICRPNLSRISRVVLDVLVASGWRQVPAHLLPLLNFTADELDALREAAQLVSLSDRMAFGIDDALGSALDKLTGSTDA